MSKVNLQIEDKVYKVDEPVFKEIKKAFKEIERLNNKIEKAIEYIDNDFNRFDCFGHLNVAMEMSYKREELLDILKESDKE